MRLAPDRTILILTAAFGVAAVVLLWHQARTHSRLVESTAVQDAARYSDAMREFRTLYSSEVVNPLTSRGIVASHDYKERDGAIPLPATLSMLLGNAIAQSGSGGKVRLYSPYPFPWRQEEGGLGDDFQRQAWDALTRNPQEPWFSFAEIAGHPVLRYATADVMRESCVACHNTHPDSPKTNWKVGDVRGVLEVVVPLDAAVAQAQADRGESIAVVAGFVGLGLFAVVLVTRRLRRTSLELEQRVVERTSELEESQRDLQSREKKFRRIFETMADGYYRTRLSDGMIIDVNPAAAEMFGFPSVEAMLERRAQDLYANPDDREAVRELIRGGEFRGEEIEMARCDGSHFTMLTSGRLLYDTSGQPVEAEANCVDLSAQKEAEAALEQARAEADQANRAKSAFLANMSHELRTPMNAIIGYSEMLMEDAEDAEQEESVADLKKIHQSGTHLLGLINDVLDLAKIESGKMEVLAEDFDVGVLIDEVSATAEPLMSKNDNQLVIERGADLGSAHQDLTKLRQSLLNLLSNSAKFMREGKVVLKAERQVRDGVDWLTLSVRDSGIGIAADKLERVFEEFGQAEETTSRDYGGTGLGLPISRRLCRMLGGDLALESELGEGSTFTIEVPAVLPGATAEQRRPGDAPPDRAAELLD